jgi:hypothetical protein
MAHSRASATTPTVDFNPRRYGCKDSPPITRCHHPVRRCLDPPHNAGLGGLFNPFATLLFRAFSSDILSVWGSAWLLPPIWRQRGQVISASSLTSLSQQVLLTSPQSVRISTPLHSSWKMVAQWVRPLICQVVRVCMFASPKRKMADPLLVPFCSSVTGGSSAVGSGVRFSRSG